MSSGRSNTPFLGCVGEFVVKELIVANSLIEQRSWRIFPSSGWMTGYPDRTRRE